MNKSYRISKSIGGNVLGYYVADDRYDAYEEMRLDLPDEDCGFDELTISIVDIHEEFKTFSDIVGSRKEMPDEKRLEITAEGYVEIWLDVARGDCMIMDNRRISVSGRWLTDKEICKFLSWYER
ncbi:MAG: hypothetical protein GWO28_15565 [candidate division Zixibacteria bacterium]|nr:hypothetical protein [candidate division Zixibacteria bacterium]